MWLDPGSCWIKGKVPENDKVPLCKTLFKINYLNENNNYKGTKD